MNYYETSFVLNMDFKVSISEQDNMAPWEREVYIMLIEKRNKKLEEEQEGA